jgi:hypothetical protein
MSTEAILAQLKDFQRRTVDAAFDRLTAPGASKRFLVADEVGLGKTMVAKGVIAKMIDHLRDKVDRIDVVYICSNADIATQNVKRLRLDGHHAVAFPTRLTLLPHRVAELNEAKGRGDGQPRVNFISLTPATSFDLKSGFGRSDERVLLATMLRDIWSFGEQKPPLNVLSGNVDPSRFRDQVAAYHDPIDESALLQFKNALAERPELRTTFFELCDEFPRVDSRLSPETKAKRVELVGQLRMCLAASCIHLLEPDLVILDEFQRFPRLLDERDEASELARQVFRFSDPKLAGDGAASVHILLLSATPYRMFSREGEDPTENHYRDFVRTVAFLEGDPPDAQASLEATIAEYTSALYDLAEDGSTDRLARARTVLEQRLRKVMVRTERLAATADRNGMLVARPAEAGELDPRAVLDYAVLQSCSQVLDERDCIELWKSVPYLISFLDGESYAFKRRIVESASDPALRGPVAQSISALETATLPWDAIRSYSRIDPAHARLGALTRDLIDNEAWRLLWVPPSLPYTALEGPFANPALRGFTKRLVFSSWRAAPRAIAGLLSYLAEQRMVEAFPEIENSAEGRKRRWTPLLRLTVNEDGPTGMRVLALLYPSLVLARLGDPLAHAMLSGGVESPAPLPALLAEVRERIDMSLRRLPAASDDGAVDERWYWAAPLLLDRQLEPDATNAWMDQEKLAELWAGSDDASSDADETNGWSAHVAEALAVVRGKKTLGRMPDDLVEVLALLAVAGPATCLLRALDGVVSDKRQLTTRHQVTLRNAAGQTAWGFRSLFNQPEVIAMLRSNREDTPYWRLVLDYCAAGCLQAVLDEYVHVLIDHLGLQVDSVPERATDIAKHIVSALSLRTAQLKADDVRPTDDGANLRIESRSLRTHYALRLADITTDDDKVVARSDQVRKAFNSPFWPFAVATTSIGQEGLDFHMYCHAVVHWNLPSNPVDLEQREGRVHRYKGHAVRKNVAAAFSNLELHERDDLWRKLFQEACARRSAGMSDIEPYWVFPGEAKIERHLPHVAFSRERQRAPELMRALSAYRMVFGQPRQEDMLRYLLLKSESSHDPRTGTPLLDLSPRTVT